MGSIFDKFLAAIPYDAQYVGTYKPLLGWVGRTSKERAQTEMAQMVVLATQKAAVAVAAPARTESESDDKGVGRGAFRNSRFRPLKTMVKDASVLTARADDDETTRELRATVSGALSGVSSDGTSVDTGNGTGNPVMGAAFVAFSKEKAFGELVKEASQDTELFLNLPNWLGEIDYADRPDAKLLLSPVGLLDIFRQYYFDFGTLLGPSVEHLWIAPGSETELVEVYSRTDYRFQESESIITSIETEETTAREMGELSDQVAEERSRDINVGVSAEGGADFSVWRVSGSASFDYGNALKKSKTEARKSTRETTSKVATEMRKSERTLRRQSTEIRHESTRRHRISNPTDRLLSYELKRKYQQIGVQVQHVGTRLCWQAYIDTPGDELGLAELIHVTAPEDFMSDPAPDRAPPALDIKTSTRQIEIDLVGQKTKKNEDGNVDENDTYYLYEPPKTSAEVARAGGIIGEVFKEWSPMVATNEPGKHPDTTDDVIVAQFRFNAGEPPGPEYALVDVTAGEGGVQGATPGKKQPSSWHVEYRVVEDEPRTFEAILREVNFEENRAVRATVQCIWAPAEEYVAKIEEEHANRVEEYDKQMSYQAQQQFVQAARERIERVRSIRQRRPEDLRAEERTIIFRRLLERLIGDRNASDYHLLSERIRAIFDVEKMLYFVAPDWWKPDSPRTVSIPTQPDAGPNSGNQTPEVKWSQKVKFGWDWKGERPLNYWVTENSEPAPFGSSIGWLIQLDGDRYRNAFLNTPWVQAALPVRPGRERDAIAWLKQGHVEGAEGLSAEAINDDGESSKQTVEQRLMQLLSTMRMKGNTSDGQFDAGQQMYETGFRPLGDTVKVSEEPFEVFAQWLEVVPTHQIVPVPYTPEELDSDDS